MNPDELHKLVNTEFSRLNLKIFNEKMKLPDDYLRSHFSLNKCCSVANILMFCVESIRSVNFKFVNSE